MAVATINLSFDDDLVKQMDLIANTASITRNQLIYNSVKMYINDIPSTTITLSEPKYSLMTLWSQFIGNILIISIQC